MIRNVAAAREAAYLGISSVQSYQGVEPAFRQEMAGYQSSYLAGRTSRYLPSPTGINPLGTGGDFHYRTEREYFLMVERARADDRDNMVLGQGINRLVANVMSSGFTLRPDTGDSELDEDLRAGWDEWSGERNVCDYEAERSFTEMAALLFRHTIVDGDIFVLPTQAGQLQVIENHQCRNPATQQARFRDGTGMVHGVELRNGRKVAYHFTPEDLEASGTVRHPDRMRRIPAFDGEGNRQVLHIYQAKRFRQRRGVSAMAPIVLPSSYHDDLQFAALVNQKKANVIAIVRTYTQEAAAHGRRGPQTGSRTEVTRGDGSTEYIQQGGPGQEIIGQVGEQITPWTPNMPSPQFLKHASLLLAIMAINLDLPELVFLLDASRANFNAWRGAMDQARGRFSEMRRTLTRQFHREVYCWHLRRRILLEPALRHAAARTGVRILKHAFDPPAWPYVQPVQDAAADDLRLSRNLTSPRRVATERGTQWSQIREEIADDRATFFQACQERAQQLNDQSPGMNVTWRDIAFGNGGGVRVNLSGTLDEGSDQAPEPNKDEE